MTVLKSALACGLLVALAPWAAAQEVTPASVAGQATGSNQSVAYRQAGQRSPDATLAYATDEPATPPSHGGAAVASDGSDDYSDYDYDPNNNSGDGQQGFCPQGQPGYGQQGFCPYPQSGGGYDPNTCMDGMGQGPQYPDYSPGRVHPFWSKIASIQCGTGRYVGSWYISAEALVLHRSNGTGNIPIVLDSSNNNNVLLTTQNLGFNTVTAPSFMVGYDYSYHTAFEVSYFGVSDSQASAHQLGATNNLSLPGDLSLFPSDYFDSSQVVVHYASRFSNAEFNVVRKFGCWNWLIGFRYLRLNEYLDIASTGLSGTTSDYSINTRNNMFGAQLGLRYAINHNRWMFQATVKGALLGNASQQFQTIGDAGNTVLLRPNQLRDGGNLAFASDAMVSGTYQLTEHIFLKAGAQLTYVNGLVLAANQLDYTIFSTQATGLGHGGNVLFTGASFGFEFRL
jgi:Putative beta barrel porin-7 (BBP7)